MSMFGSNAWLENAFNVHVEVKKVGDKFEASAQGKSQTAQGNSEAEAVRALRQAIHAEALKGQL